MIKNLLIIVLCSLLALETLLPDVNLSDLSNLPQFVSHFKMHRSGSPDLTFAECLSLHYDNADHQATTPKDHRDFPFSKRQSYRVFFQIAHETVLINPRNSYTVVMKMDGVTDCIVHTNSVTADVWQPPRA